MALPAATTSISSLRLDSQTHPRHRARPRRYLVCAQESPSPDAPPPSRRCFCCSTLGSLLLGSPLPLQASSASIVDTPSNPLVLTGSAAGSANRRWRPKWYDALYAKAMHLSSRNYESKMGRYKREMFELLDTEDKDVLEIGIGTGPNLEYYVGAGKARVYGVDPNKEMENYARQAASSSGVLPENFSFLLGSAEDLPVKDNSMDAVIGTLVLCSVKDVDASLREVKRVLKPGGIYLFMEHVAAKDGSFLRLIQTILDPLQQFVADGCHLTRKTGKKISEAGFSETQITMTFFADLLIFGPHVYGFARK